MYDIPKMIMPIKINIILYCYMYVLKMCGPYSDCRLEKVHNHSQCTTPLVHRKNCSLGFAIQSSQGSGYPIESREFYDG